jgi:hypothetical protein
MFLCRYEQRRCSHSHWVSVESRAFALYRHVFVYYDAHSARYCQAPPSDVLSFQSVFGPLGLRLDQVSEAPACAAQLKAGDEVRLVYEGHLETFEGRAGGESASRHADRKGATALHLAASAGHLVLECVLRLLDVHAPKHRIRARLPPPPLY